MQQWKTKVLELLREFPRSPEELGISRIKKVLNAIGSPQEAFPAILIAGTNGKGSVAAFLDSILRESGYKTGRYTSPHLKELTERISISGRDSDFQTLYGHLQSIAKYSRGTGLSYFEALTVAAFLMFQEANVDMGIIEVGLGGRLDATNVVNPLISVITSISMDHQRLLGDTLQAIAREKAGITRPGTPVLFGTPRSLFDDFLEGHLLSLGGIPQVLGRDFAVLRAPNGFTYKSGDMEIKGLMPSLPGAFQYENAALAIRAVELLIRRGWDIPVDAIRRGLVNTRWPARLQVIRSVPITVVDGAHNVGAAGRLVETIRKTFKFNKLIMVHSSKPNKDYKGFLRIMSDIVDTGIETWVQGMEDVKVLHESAIESGIDSCIIADPVDAIKWAWQMAGSDDLVLICGSLYLAGEVLRWADERDLNRSRSA